METPSEGGSIAGLHFVDNDANVDSRTAVWGETHLIPPKAMDFYRSENPTGQFCLRPEFKCFWNSRCSPSIKLFLWKICIGKVPVRGLLSRWSAMPSDCVRCPGILETADHQMKKRK